MSGKRMDSSPSDYALCEGCGTSNPVLDVSDDRHMHAGVVCGPVVSLDSFRRRGTWTQPTRRAVLRRFLTRRRAASNAGSR